MAINPGQFSAATTTASALGSLILVTPNSSGYQPQSGPVLIAFTPTTKGTVNPPSFLFDYDGEQTVDLESDITDHYIEDNTAINDQVSIKPELITTKGFIGELTDVAPLGLNEVLQQAQQKLTVIGAYTPELTASALIAYGKAFQAYQAAASVINSGISSWATLSGAQTTVGNAIFKGPQNNQQTMFKRFYGYWRNRTLFSVQTPWAVFQNCAIKSLRSVQDEETKTITTFDVTFKVMRFAKAQTNQLLSFNMDARAAVQASTATVGGQTPTVSESFTSQPLVSNV